MRFEGGKRRPAEAVSAPAVQLRQLPQVAAAYLARKEVRHLPEQPIYVLAVQLKARFRTEGYHSRMCQTIAGNLQFPGEAFVVSLALLPWRMRRRIRRLPGARIL